jgi:hypothetical protein
MTMIQGLPRWPPVTDEEANSYRHDPVRRREAAGSALIAVGWLGLACNYLLYLVLTLLPFLIGAEPVAPGPPRSSPFAAFVWFEMPAVVVYSLVIAGGYRMRQGRSRWLALTAGILAMLPCSPAVVAGLPVGVWALTLLAET